MFGSKLVDIPLAPEELNVHRATASHESFARGQDKWSGLIACLIHQQCRSEETLHHWTTEVYPCTLIAIEFSSKHDRKAYLAYQMQPSGKSAHSPQSFRTLQVLVR